MCTKAATVALKVCAEPTCPELIERGTPQGRCPTHRATHERERGTREQRGYDYQHRKLRERWAQRVAAGDINCARCGERISPLEDWHLDHTDDRTGYLGPSHPACNIAAEATLDAASITLVVGAPCSGKTTYVREHMEPGDIVLDYDTLAVALGSPVEHGHHKNYIPFVMDATQAILNAARTKGGRVWWIKCWPTAQDFARAHSTVWMDADMRTCHDRANAARRPSEWYRIIEDWYDLHGARISRGA